MLVAKGTWVAEQVVEADCGLAIDYTKEALRSALRQLQMDLAGRERMGRNALRLAKERHNWSRDEAVLLSAYERTLRGRRP